MTKQGLTALTEKEKQALRLIVRGHDAKSVARSLGLSVHTINERLRDARRKLEVPSSREAARLLFEAEGGIAATPPPEMLGDVQIGDAPKAVPTDREKAPVHGVRLAHRHPWITLGVTLMTLVLGLLALTGAPLLTGTLPQAPAASAETTDPQVVEAARQWLALLDHGQWETSYRATGAAFRKLNTAQVWATTSDKVRAPLGAMISRTLVSEENLPAPPYGYEVVKFRTHFANKAEAVETVTLDREDGSWRVVGVMVG